MQKGIKIHKVQKERPLAYTNGRGFTETFLTQLLPALMLFIFCLPFVSPLQALTDEMIKKTRTMVDSADNFYMDNPRGALEIYQTAMEKTTADSALFPRGELFYKTGRSYYRLFLLDSADIWLNKALVQLEKERDSVFLTLANNLLGNVYWFLDKQSQAMQHHEKALELAKTLGNDRETGRAINNIANIYRRWGDYSLALDYFNRAIPYFQSSGDIEGVAWLYFSLGTMYKQLKNYNKAVESVHAALAIYSEMAAANKDSGGVFLCYWELGSLNRFLGKYDVSLDYYRKTLNSRSRATMPIAQSDDHLGIGQTYFSMGELDRALSHLLEAKKLREGTGIGTGQATVQLFLARTYSALGEIELAEKAVLEGIDIAKRLKRKDRYGELLYEMAEILRIKSQQETALNYLEQYNTIRDSLMNYEIARRLASLQIQYELSENEARNNQLTQENKIHNLELHRANIQKNVLYLTIIIISFLIFSGLYLYFRQTRDNSLLNEKNELIRQAHQKAEQETKERAKISLEREKLLKELQQNLENVKTLRGLIPICVSCKNIRTDKGYYIQLEQYVSDHSDATFSHGICPDCMKELYGDYLHDEAKSAASEQIKTPDEADLKRKGV
jgi:tetratricopeptide (TPR) repeat protein